jgi:hypothetical protein
MPAASTVTAQGAAAQEQHAAPMRLVVAWQHPDGGLIEPVGFVSYDGRLYRFAYISNALSLEGFQPLLGFDSLRREYVSEQLFPLFAQRAMDVRRPDYPRYVASLGLSGEPEPWDQIARSQGLRRGDTLQLVPEPVIRRGALDYPFLVNGIRHVHEEPLRHESGNMRVSRDEVEAALQSLKPGSRLDLVPEPRNPVNPCAIVVAASGIPVGWVPDLLAGDVRRLMKRTTVHTTAEQVNGPEAPSHLRLLARLKASPPSDFQFFVDEKWKLISEVSRQ